MIEHSQRIVDLVRVSGNVDSHHVGREGIDGLAMLVPERLDSQTLSQHRRREWHEGCSHFAFGMRAEPVAW